MPKMTVKQLGDRIRADLRNAQRNGAIPDRVGEFCTVRYEVRASNPKAGPKVVVTIGGVDPLIPGYPNLTADDCRAWMASDGAALLARVDRIRNAYNPDPPIYSGEVKFGPIFLSADVTAAQTIGAPDEFTSEELARAQAAIDKGGVTGVSTEMAARVIRIAETKAGWRRDFQPGRTVHWNAKLRDDWYAGRARVGGAEAAGTGVIVRELDNGFCGTCDYYHADCAGPWFEVDFAATGIGSYAAHELEPA